MTSSSFKNDVDMDMTALSPLRTPPKRSYPTSPKPESVVEDRGDPAAAQDQLTKKLA